MGNNWVKIAHLVQRRISYNILLCWVLSIYCALSNSKVWKKILRLGPEIKASIILSHNWAVIGHSVQKGIFLEISLKWFFSTYCFQSCCKIWKKSLMQILEYKTACFWATIGLNLPTWTRRGFSGKFTWVTFFYLLCPIILQNLKTFKMRFLRHKLA